MPLLLLAAAAACSLAHPTACRDTNQLASSPGFRAGITRFLGNRRVDQRYGGGTVVSEAYEVLHGPPDAPTQAGGSLIFTACQAHSCGQKGALVITPGGAIQAVAILSSTCTVTNAASDCPSHNRLTIYNRSAPAQATQQIWRWASEQVAQMYVVPGQPRAVLDGIDMVSVR